MTNLNTGEISPEYRIDKTLYERRPADPAGRLDKELRSYDLLDSLGVPFVRDLQKSLSPQCTENRFLSSPDAWK